ncbi:MAG TPA: tol-pal system-associated acyl-CoA thioesterase [Aestuariivirga sp.]|nr:tol-pal system-associated acyl-CoA thioesterase [Aestuariivirga sp.]
MTVPERWPDIAGRISGGVHILPIRVYYEDTDFSGAVYHANYLKFCERARSDCLRLLGIHHHRLDGMGFVVRRMICDFSKPAKIDDLLEVETRFHELGGARIEVGHTIKRGEEVMFSGQVTVALVGSDGRPKRLPKAMAAVLTFHPESEP